MNNRSERFPRSKVTRDRITAAARRQFAENGYERTTIRSVAAEADIHASMVMRYFESKEGLFAAAVTFDLELPDLTNVPRDRIGEAIIGHFLERWEGRGRAVADLPSLLRAAVTNSTARGRLLDIFRKQVVPRVASVAAEGREGERAALMATQILGLAYGRYVLKLPAITKLDQETIKREVGPTLQRYLCGDGRAADT